jgi:hypothetical protein
LNRNAGINWVLGTFGVLCVMHLLPWIVAGGGREVSWLQPGIVALALLFTIGAWQRDFWGFVGVLSICATAVPYDVVVLVAGAGVDIAAIMNALLYGVVAAALFTARRQFPRRRAAR